MARYGIIAIYRNKKSGTYIVQPMSRHPTGAVGDFGDPTPVSEAELDSKIAHAVRENLDKFDRKPFKREEAPRFSNAEYAQFTRAHDRVSITRQDSGVFEITPSERVKVGYEGITEAMITLREDEPQTSMAAELREAFKRCR